MMKMLIELDEDKIRKEGIYSLDKMNAYLESLFEKRNMYKDEENWYTGGNFVSCGSLVATLSRTDWFLECVGTWLWYDSSDDSIEDLKAHYNK